jgi:phosphoadenosine phosphosulfate reductase
MSIADFKELDIEAYSAEDLLKWAIDAFHPDLALACSFEDIVLVHMMHSIRPDIRVFALDTGRLDEETYELAEITKQRFGIEVEWYFPKREDVEKLERENGLFSFRTSLEARHECCRVRKVEPLSRALSGLRAWVTGLRRDQGVTRTELQKVERDDAHGGIIKLNPMADWTSEQTSNYIREHKLPHNRLYDRGYLSVGCAPCTRPVGPGEHSRAGRWWWEHPEHKECGLHVRDWNI